jgi:hypothetical protein
LEVSLSLALGPLQNLLELGINTHSHDAGSSVRCFTTLGKPLSKDKVTKGKEAVKEEERENLEEDQRLPVRADFSQCADRL